MTKFTATANVAREIVKVVLAVVLPQPRTGDALNDMIMRRDWYVHLKNARVYACIALSAR